MEKDFWFERWQNMEIGFHLNQANPLLVKHFAALELPKHCRIFVPLCGKTLDMHWLLDQGYFVAGAELSETAVQQLFAELGVEPRIEAMDGLKSYSAEGIIVYVGDIFALTVEELGDIDAVYDRAALVALPEAMRKAYTEHLLELTNTAPQLLITFVYDQAKMPGPPFSVSDNEVASHYGEAYQLTRLESADVAGGLKGQCEAAENVWLLK